MRDLKFNDTKTPYLWFVFAVSIYFLPVLIANIHYVDDQGRAIWGYTGWARDGRPFAELLMIVLNFNTHITDLFPLPAIISIFLVAGCMHKFSNDFISEKNKFVGLLIPLGVLSSPFLIENSMYRFDVLPMFSTIALSFIAVLFTTNRMLVRVLVTAFLTLCILSTYQASLNFLLVIILCHYVIKYYKNESGCNLLLYIIEKSISILVGALLYFSVVIPLFLTVVGDPDHPSIKINGVLGVIYNNFVFYFNSLFSGLYGTNSSIATTITLASLILMTTFIAYRKLNARLSFINLIHFSIVSLSPLVAVALSFASLLPLQYHIEAPRVMIGFSAATLFFFTVVYLFSLETRKEISYLLLIPLLYILGLMCAYTNAMNEEKNITSVLFHQIKNDAYTLNKDRNQMVIFNGKKQENEVFVNAKNNYPIISRFFPEYFYNWDWPFPYMNRVGVDFKHPDNIDVSLFLRKKDFCSSQKVINSYEYDLYSFNDIAVVDFDKNICK